MENQDVNQLDSGVKKKNTKKIGIILAFAIVVILSSVFVIGKTIWAEKRSDEQIIADSLVQTALMETSEKVVTINIDQLKLSNEIDDVETKLMLSMVEDLELEFTLRSNEATEEAEVLFALNMRGVNILNGLLYMNDEIVGIDIPLIDDQPLYMTWEDIAAQHEINFEEKKAEIKEVRKKLLEKDYEAIEQFDATAYEAMITAFIAEVLATEVVQEKMIIAKEKVEVKTYTMNTDLEQVMTFINSVLYKLEEEQKLSEKLKIENKLELDIDGIKKYINGDFITTTSIQDDLILKSKTIMVGTIDGLIDTTIDATLSMEYLLENQKEVQFDGLELKRAINVSALTEDEKKALKLEVKNTLMKNIEENQLLSSLSEYIDLESLFGE